MYTLLRYSCHRTKQTSFRRALTQGTHTHQHFSCPDTWPSFHLQHFSSRFTYFMCIMCVPSVCRYTTCKQAVVNSHVGAENQTQILWRNTSALNLWVISPAPTHSIFNEGCSVQLGTASLPVLFSLGDLSQNSKKKPKK